MLLIFVAVVNVSLSFSIFTACDILYRLSELWEELNHINSRYKNRTEIFFASFPDPTFYPLYLLAFIFQIVLPKFLNDDVSKIFLSFGQTSFIISAVASLLAFQSTGIVSNRKPFTLHELHLKTIHFRVVVATSSWLSAYRDSVEWITERE